MRSTRFAPLLAVSCLVAAPAWAQEEDPDIAFAQRLSNAFAKVAERALPATVFIEVERDARRGRPQAEPFGDPFLERFFGRRRRAEPEQRYVPGGQGSGFLVAEDGTIVTNHHVVQEADRVWVTLASGERKLAKLVGSDPQTDLAVIRLEEPPAELPTLRLGSSAALRVGEWVVAVGNPFGLAKSVTVGIVSAKGRSRMGIADYEDFIQTDAAVNPGNSGGPLVNLRGEVVGVNSAIFSRSGGYQGIAFAIPSDLAGQVLDQLVRRGKVTRGYLGVIIQDLSPELAESMGLPPRAGVLVAQVGRGSPAEAAGIEVGDLITRLNGKPVRDVAALRNAVSLTEPGSGVRVHILRDGEERELAVRVGSLAEANGQAAPTPGGEPSLGLTLAEVGREESERSGFPPGSGLLIKRVDPGTPAARAELRAGELIVQAARRPVRTLDAFARILEAVAGEGRLLLLVSDGRAARWVVLRLR